MAEANLTSAIEAVDLPLSLQRAFHKQRVARAALEAYADAAIAAGLFPLADELIAALDAADGDPDLEASGWCVGGSWDRLPEDSERDFGTAPSALYGFDQSRHAWQPDGRPLFPGLPVLEEARALGLVE